MMFISYAQNFEDVMLWRALKHVKDGFYIDVGANDPTVDSVTKAFYERGWRGINIEPLPSHHRDLQAERPRDINLCCAAGETSGEINLFESTIRGWATAEQSVADQQLQEGYQGVYHRVPLRPLSDICREYVSGEIHFLKIDVEGLEKHVIAGADLHKSRPWIVVVEATKPNSTEEIHEQWEGLLLAAAYRFAYADGLNRFYVASEQADLLPAFKYPPNVFDGFMLNAQLQAEARANEAAARTQEAEAMAQHAEAMAQQAIAMAQHAEAIVQRAEARAQQAEARAQQAEARAQQAEVAAKQAEAAAKLAETMSRNAGTTAQHAQTTAHQAESTAQHAQTTAQQAESTAQNVEQVLNAVYASRSWRITAPLRWLGRQMRQMRTHPLSSRIKAPVKRGVKFILRHGMRFVDAFPTLRRACVLLARKTGAFDSLRAIYLRVSGQYNIQAMLNLQECRSDAGDGTAPPGPQGTLDIDEILSRIRLELKADQEQEKR